jgi:hypothetical protein
MSVEACVAAHTAKLAAAGRVKALVLVHVLFQNGLGEYALGLMEQQDKLNYLSKMPTARLAAILAQQPQEQALDAAYEQGLQQVQQQQPLESMQDLVHQQSRQHLDQQMVATAPTSSRAHSSRGCSLLRARNTRESRSSSTKDSRRSSTKSSRSSNSRSSSNISRKATKGCGRSVPPVLHHTAALARFCRR